MKKSFLILSLAALVCAACQSGTTCHDVTTFGLKGDVKEVWFSDALIASSADEEAEEAGDPVFSDKELQMTFDAQGRVTLDENRNRYEYDADGQFVRGQLPQTTVERDDKGRIVTYDNTAFDDWDSEDFDVYDFFVAHYTYDAQGRVVTEELGGWEWGTTYTYVYEGNNVYPSSASFEGGAEGWNEEGTITFEYSEFDANGNWTDRIVTTVNNGWEEPWEEDMKPEVETVTYTHRQLREITYWTDK